MKKLIGFVFVVYLIAQNVFAIQDINEDREEDSYSEGSSSESDGAQPKPLTPNTDPCQAFSNFICSANDNTLRQFLTTINNPPLGYRATYWMKRIVDNTYDGFNEQWVVDVTHLDQQLYLQLKSLWETYLPWQDEYLDRRFKIEEDENNVFLLMGFFYDAGEDEVYLKISRSCLQEQQTGESSSTFPTDGVPTATVLGVQGSIG